MKIRFRNSHRMFSRALVSSALIFGITACEAPSAGPMLGQDEVSGPVATIPPGANTGNTDDSGNNTGTGGGDTPANPGNPDPGGSASTVVGPSCHSSDANQICLGLKYVVYED